MLSNAEKSRRALEKFGIQSSSELIQPMLEKNTIDGVQLFFEFIHLDHALKCRFAFQSTNGLNIESYLHFNFNTSPIAIVVKSKYVNKRGHRCAVFTYHSLIEINQFHINVLVDTILNSRFKKR